MTKLISITALAVLLFSQTTCAQSPTNRRTSAASNPSASPSSTPQSNYPNLKIQAEETANAFVHKDFKTIVDLTYPRVVEFMGGREKMVSAIEQGVKQAEGEGITFVSVDVGEPEKVISVGRQLFSIVPTTLKMKVPGGTLIGESFMIGVSENGGSKWTFVDGAGGIDKGKLRTLFPSAADKLQLPERKQPVFHPDK